MRFAEVLAAMLRRDPGRPLVTFYDEGTGERTELSVTTFANWVAKTSALLAEEYDAERGHRIQVDLPPHWLGPVFLGAAWSLGLLVTDTDVDIAVCGPAGLERWTGSEATVIACSLHPMALRFAEPLPDGIADFGVEVWSQPDGYSPYDPPGPADDATDLDGSVVAQEELWRTAAAGSSLTDGGRLLMTANPASPPGIALVSEAFARNGSLVLVAGASPERLAAIAAAERVTALPGQVEAPHPLSE